jgi:hypothetical protein
VASIGTQLVGPGVNVGTGDTTVYTSPASTRSYLTHIKLMNTHTVQVTLRICINSLTVLNSIWWDVPLPAGTSYDNEDWGVILDPADTLRMSCSVANVVSVNIFGGQESPVPTL